MHKLFLIVQCFFFFYAVDSWFFNAFDSWFFNAPDTEPVEFIVHFFPNGANSGEKFVVSTKDLTSGFQALFVRLKDEIPTVVAPQSHTEEWKGYRIYNESGNYLRSTQELINYKEKKLYLVPQNRYFIWPYVRIGHRVNAGDYNEGNDSIILESLSIQPRVFFIHNLFKKEEADALIHTALTSKDGPHGLLRSTTGSEPRENRDLDDEASVDSERTSDNAWDSESPAAVKIINRIFDVVRVPYAGYQADGLQLVRYRIKNAYRQHHDYFDEFSYGDHNFDPVSGGTNRFATVFLYLNDVELGGQTVFPDADALTDDELGQLDPNIVEVLSSHKKKKQILPKLEELFNPNSWEAKMSSLCYTQLSVKPKLGTAVLFYSMKPDWKMDKSSLHGGCPVLDGLKWGANMWIWNGPYYDTPNAPKITSDQVPPEDDDISVKFTNSFKEAGQLYWENQLLEEMGSGELTQYNTFDGHFFRFEIDGRTVWSHKIRTNDGDDQYYIMSPKKSNIHEEL